MEKLFVMWNKIASHDKQKKKGGGYMVVEKNQILDQFWANKGLLNPPRSLPSIMINMKPLSIWCSIMKVGKNWRMTTKK